jgi:spermidine synthase
VPELATAEFYDAAYLALEPGGVLAVNFMDDDPSLERYLDCLANAFGGAVFRMRALYDPNVLAFAAKDVPLPLDWDALRRRAEALESRLGLPFRKYAKRLRPLRTR